MRNQDIHQLWDYLLDYTEFPPRIFKSCDFSGGYNVYFTLDIDLPKFQCVGVILTFIPYKNYWRCYVKTFALLNSGFQKETYMFDFTLDKLPFTTN